MSTRTITGEAPTPRARLASPRRLLRLRSDAALAERYAEGDEAAFAVLFERHRASVLAVCMGVLSSRHDAEDAAQESFVALAVALRASPPRDLRAWLVRVARNAAIDAARRRKLRVCMDGEVAEGGGPSVDSIAVSQSVKHELESVLAGIRELPESQRTALLMRELAGHSYGEIGALLDLDEDAVRGLIARARMGLRQHREAAELPCAAARAAIATEPDGRRHSKTVRRHVRGCAACRSYRRALRDDAKALKGLVPVPAGSVAGGGVGGALFGGLAAKGALVGAGVAQMTAACAVSVCAVGGIVLLTPSAAHHQGGWHGGSSGGVRPGAAARARSGAGTASQSRVAAAAPGASGSAAAARAAASSSSPKGTGHTTGRYQGSRSALPARFSTHWSALGSTLGGNGGSSVGERPVGSATSGASTAPHPGEAAPVTGGPVGPGSGSQPSGNPGPGGSGSSGSGPSGSGSGSSGGGGGASPTGSTPAETSAATMQSSPGGTPGSWPAGSGGSGGGGGGGGGGSSAGGGIPRP